MPSSIREQIVEAIKATLVAMDTPTFEFKFDIVQRQSFTSIARGKKYVAAIFDDSDTRSPDTDPVVRINLQVAIEFVVYIEKGQDPTTELNLVLSEVERALMVDRSFGKLAIDTTVDRTEHDIDGRFDKHAESTMFITVRFRVNNKDPRAKV